MRLVSSRLHLPSEVAKAGSIHQFIQPFYNMPLPRQLGVPPPEHCAQGSGLVVLADLEVDHVDEEEAAHDQRLLLHRQLHHVVHLEVVSLRAHP